VAKKRLLQAPSKTWISFTTRSTVLCRHVAEVRSYLWLQEHLEVLLEHFRELQDSSKQRAVINIDDAAAAAVLEAASGVPRITFGIENPQADVRVESLELSLWRTTVSTARNDTARVGWLPQQPAPPQMSGIL
jgi:hypothetical protein